MDIQLRWIASTSASGYHAADALMAGRRLADVDLAAALAEPSASLATALDDSAVDRQQFMRHLLPLSAGIHVCRELAQVALTKTIGRARQEDVIDRVVGPLSEIQRAAASAKPGLTDELTLRGEPLRMQWEARGSGLLKETARLTDPAVMVAAADVVLVFPATGGGGRAHLAYNSVRIEAVLADRVPGLPEVLRLGWLLSMLNLDLPTLGERIGLRRLRQIAPLAMLPAVLMAAEIVELARYDEATLQMALAAWQNDLPPAVAGDSETALRTIRDWWQTHTEGGAGFSVALAALDQMIA